MAVCIAIDAYRSVIRAADAAIIFVVCRMARTVVCTGASIVVVIYSGIVAIPVSGIVASVHTAIVWVVPVAIIVWIAIPRVPTPVGVPVRAISEA